MYDCLQIASNQTYRTEKQSSATFFPIEMSEEPTRNGVVVLVNQLAAIEVRNGKHTHSSCVLIKLKSTSTSRHSTE